MNTEEIAERTPLVRRQSSELSASTPAPSPRKIRCVAILLGQFLSILLCLSAVTSVYLTTIYNVQLPTFQNFLFYCVLSSVFTSKLACRNSTSSSQQRGDGGNLFTVLRKRGWRYFLLAFCDAEANFLVVKAYQYTTLTSVQLLDCFTIPTVLLLSRFLLRIKYKWIHISGVVICLLGVSCLVWADIEEGIPLGLGNDRLIGDILCLSGAFLYGLSNVAQEFLVKTFDMVEFLGMIGIFGAIITGTQACVLEWDQVTLAVGSSSFLAICGLLCAFAFVQFSFYILAAQLMKISGATVYNLSILTADFYSLIVGIVLFQYQFHSLYFISFVLVILGVTVFSLRATSKEHSSLVGGMMESESGSEEQENVGIINSSSPEVHTTS